MPIRGRNQGRNEVTDDTAKRLYKQARRTVKRSRDRIIRRHRVDKDHPLIIYAAFPKSASLFLLKLISKGTKLKARSTRIAEGNGQSIIDKERFIHCLDGRSVVYGHIPCNSYHRSLIRPYERRILVTVRSLPEVVASLKDHIESRGTSPLDPKIGDFPEYYPGYFDADDRTRLGFIIDYLVPWYFQFLVSWVEESRHSPVLWVPYEQIVQRPKQTTCCVAKFCGVSCERALLDAYLADAPRVNFNKGIPGRGFELLDEDMHRKLAALASYHRAYLGDTALAYLLRGESSDLFAECLNRGVGARPRCDAGDA